MVVGRKNWNFAGSDEGGRRADVIYTLVESCKRHGVDAFAYFRYCLEKILTIKDRQISELFPLNWKKIRESSAERTEPAEIPA